MQYFITGITHDMGFRVFSFEGIGEDRVRTEFKVRADLALIRKYGIRVQELPLLCRGILEGRNEDEELQTFTYTESDMLRNAELCALRALDAQKRRAPRKPPSDNVGAAWRGPHV
ncbi:MAG: hypothetical protein ACRD7E_27495 [Bryobacteraceae bacterium]